MKINQRPLSPHLSIYKLPLAAKLSILHRVTGFALFIGTLIICWVTIFMISTDYEPKMPENCLWLNIMFKLILVGWSFSLFYHLCNGIRHLIWDIGYGLDLKTVNITNYIIIFASLLLTLLPWLIIYGSVEV